MIAQMLQRKRRSVASDSSSQEGGFFETFHQFHIRVNREIKNIIAGSRPHLEVGKTIKTKQQTFAGHIARFGIENRKEHLVKHIAMWRNASWWKTQRQHNLKGNSHTLE